MKSHIKTRRIQKDIRTKLYNNKINLVYKIDEQLEFPSHSPLTTPSLSRE